jgi:LAO/AO transport system kinase
MTDKRSEWADKISSGDRRAMARAISAVEQGAEVGRELLKELFPRAGKAYVVGITGSPGTGKSTLVEKLARNFRAAGFRVGIIAIDPTSPFSGGAILGDRIRMQSLSGDEGIYIRSMAARGQLGGLAPTTFDVATILDAAGCQVVMIETVGVGQDEIEVARLADVTALLLVPSLGDDVQIFKAGVIEVADLFVINKADLAGAERVEGEVIAMLGLVPHPPGWRPPVLRTVATTGEGVAALRERLEEFRDFGDGTARERRRREQCRGRLLELLRKRLFERALADRLDDGTIDRGVEEILARRRDPHAVVDDLIAGAAVSAPYSAG